MGLLAAGLIGLATAGGAAAALSRSNTPPAHCDGLAFLSQPVHFRTDPNSRGTMADRRSGEDHIGRALVATGLLMVFVSLLDLGSNLWPFFPSAVEWRYGAVGILSGFTVTPLLGIVLMVAGAYSRAPAATVRVWASCSWWRPRFLHGAGAVPP